MNERRESVKRRKGIRTETKTRAIEGMQRRGKTEKNRLKEEENERERESEYEEVREETGEKRE